MDFILLRDYGPFKKGQVVRLGPMTSEKLIASGVIRACGPAIPSKATVKSVPAISTIEDAGKEKGKKKKTHL